MVFDTKILVDEWRMGGGLAPTSSIGAGLEPALEFVEIIIDADTPGVDLLTREVVFHLG